MRKVSFLVCFSFILSIQQPFLLEAYTLVLQNGKSVDGVLIGDDGPTIRLRDERGIEMSFQKSRVDLRATQLANVSRTGAVEAPAIGNNNPAPHDSAADVVAAARRARSSRTGSSRIYTADDLARMPELSAFEEPDHLAEPAAMTQQQQQQQAPAPAARAAANESYWRREAAGLNRQVDELRQKATLAERLCRQARGEQQSVRVLQPRRAAGGAVLLDFQNNPEPADCRNYALVAERLKAVEQRRDDFLERARRAEIPRDWVE